MTDQEINEAVARKLGWNLNETGHIGVPPHRSMGFESIPDYCHSIAAAWEVVEHLAKTKLVGLVMGAPWKWIFTIEGRKEGDTQWADTATMAICLAFLKLG